MKVNYDKLLALFLYSILAGICIGIGGLVYLSVDNKIVGSLLFAIGLLLILINKFTLYTGVVSYVEFRITSFFTVVVVLIGNIIGAFTMGLIFHFAKPELLGKATELCMNKMEEEWSIIPLSIFCNILIFFAVDTWKKIKLDYAIRIVSVFLCVSVFILCGFEHSIANMFYFTYGGMLGLDAFLYLFANIIFNGVGGIAVYNLVKFSRRALT